MNPCTFEITFKLLLQQLQKPSMKIKKSLCLLASFCIGFTTLIHAQQVKTNLSNLTTPTAINVNYFTPKSNGFQSLGSPSKQWQCLYLRDTLYLGELSLNGKLTMYISGELNDNFYVGPQAGSSGSFTSQNTGVGINACGVNECSGNTAVGYSALGGYCYGDDNIAVGRIALFKDEDGSYNTAIGTAALSNNRDGSSNTAVGNSALFLNQADNNTATGEKALYNNNSGFNNTANGYLALYSNTTGNSLSATGDSALYSNTEGMNNTANGSRTLFYNTTGQSNVANGVFALYNNISGSNNTANGAYALYNNKGENNTGTGDSALVSNTTGTLNIADGVKALQKTTTGTRNTAVGVSAGEANTTGIRNTFIGYHANTSAGNFTNATALGNEALVTASNQVRIGNSDVTSIGGSVNWSTTSDGRVKKNIKQNVPGLAFINKLEPVTYSLDLEATERITQGKQQSNEKTVANSEVELNARKEKEQVSYSGLVAQDVEKAAKEINYDFSGVDVAKNDKDLYGLRYSEFIAPLIKSVQELSKQNDALQKQNNALEARLSKLEAMMNIQLPSSAASVSSAFLEQNIPNPSKGTTVIGYTLPQQYTSARIIIADQSGKTLKQIPVSGNGKGNVTMDTSILAAGAYQYSLYINGVVVATKDMVITR